MRAVRRWLTYANIVAALIVVSLACLVAPQSVLAAVVYDQTEGTSGVSVPSQESPEDPASTTQVADDILVPVGEHWEVTEVEVLGRSASTGPRSFNVFLYEDSQWGPGRELLAEYGVTSSAPDYSLPLRGAPPLNPGTYWISVQAVGPTADWWSWDAVSPQRGHWRAFWRNPGNARDTNCTTWWTRESCLEGSSGQPDQAFKLIGTFEQVLTSGSYGNSGGVASSPPGISCPPTCSGRFDRSTVVTLTGFPLDDDMEFAGWRRGPPAVPPSPTPTIPLPTDLPCASLFPCQLTLNEDMTIYGTYRVARPIRLGKVKRDLKDGTAKLLVRIPTDGVLSMEGNGVKAFREPEAKPGTVFLPLLPKAWTARRLARMGKVKVKLRIKFRASGNTARAVVKAVTLRQLAALN